jgi:hypothetical protein
MGSKKKKKASKTIGSLNIHFDIKDSKSIMTSVYTEVIYLESLKNWTALLP